MDQELECKIERSNNIAKIAAMVSIVSLLAFCCATLYSISSCLEKAVNEPVAVEDEIREFNPADKSDGMVLMYNTRTGEAMVCRVKGDN